MSGRLDWTELLFSSAGRVPRAPFILVEAFLLVLAWLYEAVTSPAGRWITGWLVYPFLAYCAVSVAAKRLHDRGRNGWWAGLLLIAVLVDWNGAAPSAVRVLASLVLIWTAIELGLMPGEPGANRYGANPLRPVHA